MHIPGMDYLFEKRDDNMHTYLAVPEGSVLKGDDVHPKYADASKSPAISQKDPDVAPSESKYSTAAVIGEQTNALQESEAMKEKAGITPAEFKAQHEPTKFPSVKELRHETYPRHISAGALEQGQHKTPEQPPVVHRRHSHATFDRQGSEEHQATQPIPPHPVSHNLEVGKFIVHLPVLLYYVIRSSGCFFWLWFV